jgi:hypothetical protein
MSFVDSCAFGDAADLGDIGVQRGHAFEGSTSEAVLLEVMKVGHTMHEDVGALSERDQVVVDGGVAREDDGAVRRVETVGESGKRPAVRNGDGRDPNHVIFEDGDRDGP